MFVGVCVFVANDNRSASIEQASLRAGSLLGSRARAVESPAASPLAFAAPPLARQTPKESLLAGYEQLEHSSDS